MRRAPLRLVGLAAAALALAGGAAASSDPYAPLVGPTGAAIGAVAIAERSLYRGAGTRADFLPLYLYEGPAGFLRSQSVGLKLDPAPGWAGEFFLRRRFEGFPIDDVPASLAGMGRREYGVDLGLAAQAAFAWGTPFAEVLHDVSSASRGSELRLGLRVRGQRGRLAFWPQATLALRSARLNDYYYGVRPEEATPGRPEHRPGRGLQPEIGLYASYAVMDRWRLLVGATYARVPQGVAASPVVQRRTDSGILLGALYDLSPPPKPLTHERPLIVRAYHGASSECDVMKIATFRCTTVHTEDDTSVSAFEVGRPLVERLNGWPLDIAGFVGLLRHHEAGLQPDFWQVNAYVKPYFYGFPWDARLRTRIGWGVGLSYARRIPFTEVRHLAARGRPTSRLLNTFDPTIDVSVGDLLGERRLRDTFVGVGVSHRSGIFGTARLLGNVSGGSNYIYGYVETSF